jgi:tRNA A-37 threonylcarbamoyl transferase component Bud32
LKSSFYTTEIESANIPAAISAWKRQARLCLGDNDRFVSGYRAGFRIYRQRTEAAEVALEFLLPDPDLAFEGAQILKQGSRNHAGVVEIAGVRYVLKRYNCRGWGYRIGNAFRRSRAVRTWLVNWQYLVRGVPVPEPLLCLEERRCRLLLRSYILMEFVEDSVSLRARWATLVAAEKLRFVEFFGELLGRMHRVGMLHGDLKWDNLLVGSVSSRETMRLVDLDGSSIVAQCDPERARKDFNRFLKDLAKYEKIENLRDCVIRAWERALV